jgi:hypothetical protein
LLLSPPLHVTPSEVVVQFTFANAISIIILNAVNSPVVARIVNNATINVEY